MYCHVTLPPSQLMKKNFPYCYPMETRGLNIFNTKYILAKPETATDEDYMHILSVIGHEYFHNWSGNRVTCRDWFQLSLKEGLTIFRDQSFSEDSLSQAVIRIQDVN